MSSTASVGVSTVRRLPPLPTIKELLSLYHLRAQKRLSQNFLLEKRLCHKIVRAAGGVSGCHVCEIGPGPGSITRALLERNVEKLIVIEKDKRFKPTLEMLAEATGDQMDIIWGDILDFNLENIFPSHLTKDWNSSPPKIHLIGNLPFSVSTPLIIRWLRQVAAHTGVFKHGRVKMTLTFQKEVAERLAAPPSKVQRSRLSIMAQSLCDVHYKFIIPGRAFLPPPEVDVGIVHFIPRVTPTIRQNFSLMEKVVKCIFHYRQKYCIRGVELLVPDKKMANHILETAGINPIARPYSLTLEEFSAISSVYKTVLDENPDLTDYDFRIPYVSKKSQG